MILKSESKANLLSSSPVAVRTCVVSFKAPSGIVHSVEVTAETLFEAGALGLGLLKKDGWIEGLGPATRLEITVREPGTSHTLTVSQIHRWCDGVAVSPDEVLRRRKVKALLEAPGLTSQRAEC